MKYWDQIESFVCEAHMTYCAEAIEANTDSSIGMSNDPNQIIAFQKMVIEVPIYAEELWDFFDRSPETISNEDEQIYLSDLLDSMEDVSLWFHNLRGSGVSNAYILDPKTKKVLRTKKASNDKEDFDYE